MRRASKRRRSLARSGTRTSISTPIAEIYPDGWESVTERVLLRNWARCGPHNRAERDRREKRQKPQHRTKFYCALHCIIQVLQQLLSFFIFQFLPCFRSICFTMLTVEVSSLIIWYIWLVNFQFWIRAERKSLLQSSTRCMLSERTQKADRYFWHNCGIA